MSVCCSTASHLAWYRLVLMILGATVQSLMVQSASELVIDHQESFIGFDAIRLLWMSIDDVECS